MREPGVIRVAILGFKTAIYLVDFPESLGTIGVDSIPFFLKSLSKAGREICPSLLSSVNGGPISGFVVYLKENVP